MALLFVQLCFGVFPLLAKWAFASFQPAVLAGWRILFAALVLSILAWCRHRRRAWVGWPDLWRLQGLALLGVVLNQVCYLEGLQRSTAVHAGLIMVLIPVFTFVIAVGLRQEVFALLRGAGIAVAAAGALCLTLQKGTAVVLTGDLLMLFNSLCYSFYLVLSRPLVQRHPPLVVIAWVFLLSAWTVPLLAHGAPFVPVGVGARAWLALGAILVFPTVIAYLLNLWALRHVRASTTAAYIYMQPLITVGLGVALLGESLSLASLGAAVLIFVGLGLVLARPGARRRASPHSGHAIRLSAEPEK
jgi:drug/metabolite transporter (DMT)-like permease